ncbi:MAG: trypsin-like peptidase domain-containing protein [Holosporaceae bacterium]
MTLKTKHLFTFLLVCFCLWRMHPLAAAKDAPSAVATMQMLAKAKKALVSVKQTVSKSAYEETIAISKSGFICDQKRGWVITTLGPVGYGASMSSYELTFSGGQKLEAKSLYRDPLYDIEVLVFEPSKLLSPISQLTVFAPKEQLDEDVLLLTKNNEQEIVQQGTISHLYETTGVLPKHVLRVSLNTPGSSVGGVALNATGELLGLILSADQTFAQILCKGYLKEILGCLRKGQKPLRFLLKDAMLSSMSLPDAVKYLDFPKERLEAFLNRYPDALAFGLVIVRAQDQSPLRVGDVVVALNGKPCGPSLFAFQKKLSAANGKEVSLQVMRHGKELMLKCQRLDAWPYVISKMILFGGALFYEADLLMHALYDVPLKALMVSKVLPGSVFAGVFSAFPSRDPVSVARLIRCDQSQVQTLADLEKLIPQLSTKPYFSVFYKDYSCAVQGGTLMTNRAPRVGFVDFIASTSIPEKLVWSDQKNEWSVEPLVLSNQKCAMP